MNDVSSDCYPEHFQFLGVYELHLYKGSERSHERLTRLVDVLTGQGRLAATTSRTAATVKRLKLQGVHPS